MRWQPPKSLGKTIEARVKNRPVKIVYLVPFDNSTRTDMIIDAVFYESYTRWAGLFTIVVPCTTEGFMINEFEPWLSHYDPDFVYSYLDFSQSFIEYIDRICCPIAFIKHTLYNIESEIAWDSFLPNLDSYIKPVSSLSNVHSPQCFRHAPFEDRPKDPTIFTQYLTQPDNRFMADNFGTGFGKFTVTNPIPGYFRTLCFTQSELPKHIFGGSENCTSVLDAFQAITDYKAIPISYLSMLNSESIPRTSSKDWRASFHIFIGTTPIERINFWNSRHLGDIWNDQTNALIVDPSMFEEESLVKQLGQYLNKHNYLGSGSGPYQAELHSNSISLQNLELFKSKLQNHTWSQIRVTERFGAHAFPDSQNIDKRMHYSLSNSTTLKLTEDVSDIVAEEPDHFVYIPAQFRGLVSGQWIVDLDIQRHVNLSQYSNIIDTWTLPRRKKITRAFTDNLAKPTIHGHLALVPASQHSVSTISRQAIKAPISFHINLPSDEDFFRHLSLNFYEHPNDDLRAALPKIGYEEMRVSDKGQNLRGVISLFEDLSSAYDILTNKYWRSVLRAVNEDSNKPLTFDLNKLMSFIPNDRPTIRQFTKALALADEGMTQRYFIDSLKDTLEHLVRLNVFYQVENWRCEYCGHLNSRSFDNMKIKNECDICQSHFFAALDIEWKYELNNFVYRSLIKHCGLPVLLTLGYLQNIAHPIGAFWYLTEVDLFEVNDDPESKNEIDILCVVNKEIYMVEVKLSASIFVNKPKEEAKFLKLIEQLCPDVAMLSFERYAYKTEDEAAVRTKLNLAAERIRSQLKPGVRLEIFVAQDAAYFDNFPGHLGWYGPRIRNYQ